MKNSFSSLTACYLFRLGGRFLGAWKMAQKTGPCAYACDLVVTRLAYSGSYCGLLVLILACTSY